MQNPMICEENWSWQEIAWEGYNHRRLLLDAFSVFKSMENYGCQASVISHIFFITLHVNFASIIFITANVYINKNIKYSILQHYYKIKLRLLYCIVTRVKDFCCQGAACLIWFGAHN